MSDIAIGQLLEIYEEIVEVNPYAYFELARTRQTNWMAWITTKPREEDPNRKILAKGQGSTPEEACQKALESMHPSHFEDDSTHDQPIP